MNKAMTALFCSTWLLTGCAHVTVKHVGDTDVSEGIHYYEPRPYLLITKTVKKDANGNEANEFINQILWLPDHSQRYVVQIHPGIGSVNGSIKLQDGWMLDTFGSETDSKVPETVAAVTGLVKAAAEKGSEPPQGLYRIDIDKDGNVSLAKQANW